MNLFPVKPVEKARSTHEPKQPNNEPPIPRLASPWSSPVSGLTQMHLEMSLQLIQSQKPFPTRINRTNKIPLTSVNPLMFAQITTFPEPFPAYLAFRRLFP